MAIFTSIGAALFGAGTFLATATALVLKTAVSLGLNLLAQAVAGKQKQQTSFPINGKIQGGGDAPRSFILGRYATAGSLVYVNSWGKDGDTDNAYCTYVIALSDLPIKQVDEIWVNGEKSSLDMTELVTSAGDGNALGQLILGQFNDAFRKAQDTLEGLFKVDFVVPLNPLEMVDWLSTRITALGGTPIINPLLGGVGNDNTGMGLPVPAYKKGGADHLWVKIYNGEQTEADPFLMTKVSSVARPWGSDRIGKGVAYAIVTVRNQKNMFSGFPEFKFVVDGTRLYDPSKDTTVGGDGPQRIDDKSTWGGDGDYFPAVQAYNLLRGLKYGTEWFYGLQGVSPRRLPVDNWIAQIAKCRSSFDSFDGAEFSYRSGGEIQVDAQGAAALEALNSACQGRIAEVGGVYTMHMGEPDTASFSFTDDDIISTEEQSFTPFFGLADTINGINATYPSPDDGWNVVTAPPLHRTDLEALHGQRRLMADVELNFVPYKEQVQRLMRFALNEGQRARRHTFVLPPKFWPYAVPGATCVWTSERNGYVSKMFRVDGVIDKANLDIVVDLTEIDPSDYDWDTDSDYEPPVVAPTDRVLPQPVAIDAWDVEPRVIVGGNGKEKPGLRLSWGTVKTEIVGIEYEVRLTNTQEVVNIGSTTAYSTGFADISTNLFSDTDYQVRGRYIPDVEAHWDALWSPWLDVRTPMNPLTDVLATLDAIGNDVKAILEQQRQTLDETRHRVSQLAAAALEATGKSIKNETVARRFRDASAVAMREMEANIVEIGDDLQSQASILDFVQAVVGDKEAGAKWRMVAQAGSGDVVSRIVLQVYAAVEDQWIDVSTIWEAGFTGGNPANPFGRILLKAKEVVIMTGALGDDPVALFTSDGLYLKNAFIHELDSNNIKARSIYGDRIVVAGVDTPELQIDSVTYVDEDSSTSNINSSPTGTLMATCAVIGYVSGGVTGAGTVAFTPSVFASSIQHIVRVVRSASPSMTSPVEVGRNMYGVYSVRDAGDATSISVAVADVPPSAGDWYYGLYFGADLITVSTSRKLVLVHGKR